MSNHKVVQEKIYKLIYLYSVCLCIYFCNIVIDICSYKLKYQAGKSIFPVKINVIMLKNGVVVVD